MFRTLLPALLASLSVLAASGCAEESDGGVATSDESDLKDVEKSGGKSQNWIYQGPLPAIEKPTIVVSLKAHTARITGLLPATFKGDLPFWAVPGTEADGRTRVTVVYPVATGAIDPETGTAPAGPGHYSELFGIAFTPTNEKASWGGFPFFKYHMRRGLAFHGPITSTRNAETGDWEWLLKRGPVSHGCERMQGEHVVELMHLLGVDMSKPHAATETFTIKVSVDIIEAWDTFEGQSVDVDYPALPAVQRPTTNVAMFPTWDSRNMPQLVCAYDKDVPLDGHHCDAVGEVKQDLYTGKMLVEADESPWIGASCQADTGCGFEVGGVKARCLTQGEVGYCTVPCEGYCSDRPGSAPTFCGAVRTEGPSSTDSAPALAGTCMAKADLSNGGCFDIEGTSARVVERFVGKSGAEARVATACSF